uniref:Ig-like domain-containing protein n=1 Tax=Pygocentrus nattereri TaxID=42514 RepID=A0AAR2ILB2_PYGNA
MNSKRKLVGFIPLIHWKLKSRFQWVTEFPLSCRYSTSNVYFYWYRQYPSSKLDLLLYMHERGSVSGSPPPGFSAKVQNKIVNLEISSAKLSDSALYYCFRSSSSTFFCTESNL